MMMMMMMMMMLTNIIKVPKEVALLLIVDPGGWEGPLYKMNLI